MSILSQSRRWQGFRAIGLTIASLPIDNLRDVVKVIYYRIFDAKLSEIAHQVLIDLAIATLSLGGLLVLVSFFKRRKKLCKPRGRSPSSLP